MSTRNGICYERKSLNCDRQERLDYNNNMNQGNNEEDCLEYSRSDYDDEDNSDEYDEYNENKANGENEDYDDEGEEDEEEAEENMKEDANTNQITNLDTVESEQEFEFIFERIKFKNNIYSNPTGMQNLSNIKLALKFLYKILKFYKLDHYIIDLIENGYFSPILLNKLKPVDLDKLNISPYDKKKFVKLKVFVKQVMTTIKVKNNNKNILSDMDLNRFLNQNGNNMGIINRQLVRKAFFLPQSNVNAQVQKAAIKEPVWNEVKYSNQQLKRQIASSTSCRSTSVFSNLNTQPKSNKPVRIVSGRKSAPLNPIYESAMTTQQPTSAAVTSVPNSVCHPKTIQMRKVAQTNGAGFFGPRLTPTTLLNNQPRDTAQVHVIENSNYNYGVPVQPQSNTSNRPKSFIRTNYKSNSASGRNSNINHHANSANTNKTNNTAVKADIFVYARKRPKLPSEAKYNDVICIENSSEEYFNEDEASEYISSYRDPTRVNANQRMNSICVDELKSSVDGTPVLRKVNKITYLKF
jgi:hypothetical protein